MLRAARSAVLHPFSYDLSSIVKLPNESNVEQGANYIIDCEHYNVLGWQGSELNSVPMMDNPKDSGMQEPEIKLVQSKLDQLDTASVETTEKNRDLIELFNTAKANAIK